MARTSSSLYCRCVSVCDWKLYHIIVAMLFVHFFTTYQISNICEKGCTIDTQLEICTYIHRHKHRIERCYKNLLHEAFMICIKNENLLEKLYWKVYFQYEHNAVMIHSTLNTEAQNIQHWKLKNNFFLFLFSLFPVNTLGNFPTSRRSREVNGWCGATRVKIILVKKISLPSSSEQVYEKNKIN